MTAPILHLSALINHALSNPVHAVYFPVPRFAALHATRVAVVWAGIKVARARAAKKSGQQVQGRIGILGDLFGYLTMAWGGGALVSILLGNPPIWLVSGTPWLSYVPIYLLLIPTGMASYIVNTCPSLVLNLVGAVVDGITRGTTISSIPTAVASSTIGSSGNPSPSAWTACLLSAIATTGGGVIVQLLGLDQVEWAIGTPNVLKGGVLTTLDVWGAALVALLYSGLLNLHPEIDAVSRTITPFVPVALRTPTAKITENSEDYGPLVDVATARSIIVLLLVALFGFRVVVVFAQSLGGSAAGRKTFPKLDPVEKDVLATVVDNLDGEGKAKGRKVKPNGQTSLGGANETTVGKSHKSKTQIGKVKSS